MPKSQSRKSASKKRLDHINDLVSSLGRIASALRQKSKMPHQLSSISLQASPLSAVPIECSKVLFNSLILVPCIDTGYLKLKRKAIDDGVEPPAKKRTLAQRDDMPLRKVCISLNVFL
jgi:hypothetical protein